MDVSAYLNRINHRSSTKPTAETLRALHRAHLLTVPFENLDIHLNRPIVLNEAALYEKIVFNKRGGLTALLSFSVFTALVAPYDARFFPLPWPEQTMVIASFIFSVIAIAALVFQLRQTSTK